MLRARLSSMEKKRDTMRRRDDVGQRRGDTKEEKGMTQCQLSYCESYWPKNEENTNDRQLVQMDGENLKHQ
jgi:hypothetical protein